MQREINLVDYRAPTGSTSAASESGLETALAPPVRGAGSLSEFRGLLFCVHGDKQFVMVFVLNQKSNIKILEPMSMSKLETLRFAKDISLRQHNIHIELFGSICTGHFIFLKLGLKISSSALSMVLMPYTNPSIIFISITPVLFTLFFFLNL